MRCAFAKIFTGQGSCRAAGYGTGWGGSRSWFLRRVAGLRVEYSPRDPADRLECRPGDQGQCDLWFPPVKIPLGAGQFGSPPVLVIVSSYSRFITA